MTKRYAQYIIYREAGEYGSLPIRDSQKASGQIERLNGLRDAVVMGVYNLPMKLFQWHLPLDERLAYQAQVGQVTKRLEQTETSLIPSA